MSKRLNVILTDDQRETLETIRDHHPKPYMRERAAAILKLASGLPAKFVAEFGLLKPRDPESVTSWLYRFLAEGLAGLQVRKGRGRKPAFFPSVQKPG